MSEAGGFVSEVDGKNNPIFGTSILAANGDLGRPMRDILRRAAIKGSDLPTGPKAARG